MAGIMDEYDPPTPVSRTYCARLKPEEYENQASQCTEEALLELIQHLEENPSSYHKVMKNRKKEQEENSGIFSYAKVKFLAFLSGKESTHVSEEECNEKVDNVTTEMIKVFNYSEESKGRRRSKRLADNSRRGPPPSTPPPPLPVRIKKRHNLLSRSVPPPPLPTPQRRKCNRKNFSPSDGFPPPPPPPPPPVPLCSTPCVNTLSRRPLSACNSKKLDSRDRGNSNPEKSSTSNGFHDVLNQLGGPNGKIMLRNRVKSSPGKTPINGWPERKVDSNLHYFKTELVDKFKNSHSPVISPMAAPGSFESPLALDEYSELELSQL